MPAKKTGWVAIHEVSYIPEGGEHTVRIEQGEECVGLSDDLAEQFETSGLIKKK